MPACRSAHGRRRVALVAAAITASPALAESDGWCSRLAAHSGSLGSIQQIAALSGVPTAGPVRLNAGIATIAPGSTVADILKRAGFLPDASNLAFVGYMNPHIGNIDRLAVGEQVFVPQIEVLRGGEWTAQTPTKPIDGIAVSARYAPRLAEMQAAEGKALADALGQAQTTGTSIPGSDPALDIAKLQRDLMGLSKAQPVGKKIADIGAADRLFVVTDQKLALARAIVAGDPASKQIGATVAASADPVPTGMIKVTFRTTETNGDKVDGLVVRYMSEGAHRIRCDLKHGLRFARESYEATHSLVRARWCFWAERPQDGRRTAVDCQDLTAVRDPEVVQTFVLRWSE